MTAAPARLVGALSARAIRRLVDVLSNELAHRRIEIGTDIASEVAWRTTAGKADDTSHTGPSRRAGDQQTSLRKGTEIDV